MTKIYYRFLKPIMVLLVFLFVSLTSRSQGSISGTVTDSIGAPIADATVTIKGTKIAVKTAEDGSFTINGPLNSTLVITSVGYNREEVELNGISNVTIPLLQGSSPIGEVVIVGYGSVRKKDLTGSITTITAKDFQKGVITTPEQLIAGKVAGVSIISNNGAPGAGSTIRIRGGSSLRASNNPLIVIDGVPVDNGGITGTGNPLSFINPNDIESITILKDASAAAIYGTRASNGVILISTKKGRSDKLRVNFSTVNSLSEITKTVEVLTANHIRGIVKVNGTPEQKAMLGTANTKWQNVIYQTAFASDNNISLTGGIKNLPYRFSLGYLDQQGILKTDHLARYSVGIAMNPVFFDGYLKVDINLKGSLQKYHLADHGAIGSAVYFDPTQPIYSNSRRFGGYFEFLAGGIPSVLAARNPLAMLYERDANSEAKRSIGNIQFDYQFPFLPKLKANLNLGFDVSKGERSIFISDSASLAYSTKGSFIQEKQTKTNNLLEFYLAYASEFKSINTRFDVLAGYSYNNYTTTNYAFPTLTARGVLTGALPNFPFNKPENTLLSYFSRLNFTHNDKYLLTATIRRDGSSRFSKANRYGTFPSLGFTWKINQENFMKNSQVVSDLKLRLGYGITGQEEIDNYNFLSVYSLSNQSATYQFGNTFIPMYRPSGYNPGIKWEETATTNIGVDYALFNNRVTGTIDFYIKKTKDLLNSVAQPAGTNFSAYQTENIGDMENKGIEFNINFIPIRNIKTTWDVAFNITYNKNRITNLTEGNNDLGFPSGGLSGVLGSAYLNAVGTARNTFFLYKQVYDKSGAPIEGLFEDRNRDGIINESDKYLSKRADPDLFLGFSTNVARGKWNAGFVIRASFNNYVYNNVYSANGRLNTITGATFIGNASANYLETKFRGNYDQQPLSDYYLDNASFLRMDNLSIGYNFGNIARNMATLRGSFTVQNVFVITGYSGLDPEISSGIDNSFYPRPRIFSLGFNLDF